MNISARFIDGMLKFGTYGLIAIAFVALAVRTEIHCALQGCGQTFEAGYGGRR